MSNDVTRNGRWTVRWTALTATAFAVGLTVRFWWSFVSPVPQSEFTIDWSPLVYGVSGLLASIMALRILGGAERDLKPLERRSLERRSLEAVCVTCVAGYVACMAVFSWRSL